MDAVPDSPQPLRIRALLFAALGLALGFGSRAGADPIAINGDVDIDDSTITTQAPSPTKSVDYFVVPIPSSNPTVGTGLDAVGMLLYKIDPASPDSYTAVGAGYTSNDSWAAGAVEKVYLDADRFRLSGGGGYANVNYDFYGIGSSQGDAGISIPISQIVTGAFIDARMRVWSAIYAGLRYSYGDVQTRLPIQIPAGLPITLPGSLDVNVQAVGIVGSYDSRDKQYSPRSGTFVDLKSLFSLSRAGQGSSHFQTYQLMYNHYLSLSTQGVLAARASFCEASSTTPFFDLCTFGTNSDLRGYAAGRYRDHFMTAGQVEYRRGLTSRFGAVVFAGAGAVAADVHSLGSSTLLPSGGLGLRYLVAPSQGISLSMDYAWGRDSQGFYMYVGDSF